MEDLLKSGLKSKAFDPKAVMDLFYGKVDFFKDKFCGESKTMYYWKAYADETHDWRIIPLEQRMEIVTLVRERCRFYKFHYNDCFHERILCLLYTLLKGGFFSSEKDKAYRLFWAEKERRDLVTEVFLWWYIGLHKGENERQLLKECWQEFLGCEKPKSQKELLKLVEKRVLELRKELQKTLKRKRRNKRLWDRIYPKKEVDRSIARGVRYEFTGKVKIVRDRLDRISDAKDKCRRSLDFLNGYLNYVAVSKGLKKKINL